MTPAPLLCALALMAGPSSTGTSPGTPSTGAAAASGAEVPLGGAFWINSGGVLLTALGRGSTIDIPLGLTLPIPGFATLTFEATYFRWTCQGNVSCAVTSEQGAFATAGFHFDTQAEKGPLGGFFLSPKLQLSGFQRRLAGAPSFDGLTFGAELGLDLGYQWRVGPFYLALIAGASGGVATHHPSGLYGLLVEWNGSSNAATQLVPQDLTYVFGFNLNVLRLGFTF